MNKLSQLFRLGVGLFSCPLPWFLKRWLLQTFLGYKLHPTARIELALILPRMLVMEEESRIGALTVAKSLDYMFVGAYSIIGRGNWITGYPKGGCPFKHQPEREPRFIIKEHSVVTHRHILICNASVEIGRFSSMGGFRSTILTHSIDTVNNRQNAEPIIIGDYCIVGTNCVLLPGSRLPDYSILGAMSLLNKAHTETYMAYGGVPAKPLKALPRDSGYFLRERGYVI